MQIKKILTVCQIEKMFFFRRCREIFEIYRNAR